MPPMTRTVIHFVDSSVFGGTEQALLHLLAGIDRELWRPVLLHHSEPGVEPLLEGARLLNVETRVVPRMQGPGTISTLPQFLRQLLMDRPAVFHAHLSWLLSCKYGLIAAALARVPAVIATAQQLMVPPWGRQIEMQQRLVATVVSQYIAVSDAVARQFCQTFGVPSAKVRVVHNSIPIASFEPSNNQGLRMALSRGREGPIVMTVARLDRQKGHVHLLQAIPQIPGATFVMVGSGPEQRALEAKARELGVADRVIFMGYRKDIETLLDSCDLFVLPSIYEGLPLSVLEAMAARKPVVATAVGGTPEAVVDGRTGILVPPADPQAIARAIRTVLSNPDLAGEMGAAGRDRVEREFSAATMAKRVTDTYDQVLLLTHKTASPRQG